MPGPIRMATAVFAAAYLVTAWQVAAQEPPRPSTEAFIRPSEFTDVQLSPDGKYISALVPRPDSPFENLLAVFDTATIKPVSTMRAGSSNLIYRYHWVNDHRLILALGSRVSSLDHPVYTGELVAFDADGSHGLYLFGRRGGTRGSSNHMLHGGEGREAYARLIDSAPVGDGRSVLVQTQPFTNDRTGSVPSIERLDVVSGNVRRVTGGPAPDADIVLDHAGEPRAATSDVLTHPRLWTREAGKDWELLNDATKSGVEIMPIGFNRDNSRLYVSVTHSEGPDSIELLDLRSGQRTLVYRGQFADPADLLPTADRQDFYAVVTADGAQTIHYLDPDSREAQITEALSPSFPGQLVRLVSFTADGKLAIASVSSDRNPGDYYLFDLEQRQARYLFSERRWLAPNQMRPMQAITIAARDSLTLHGFLTEPSGKGPFPLVVLPHGGPHGVADAWAFDEETQLLAGRGYAVLQINFRGSSGYGAQFARLGYRQWGLSMQDDLTDATQWAIREGHADARRICIFGASYGGYAALEGAVREPDLYKCAIGYAGIYDLRLQLDKSDTQRTNDGLSYLKTTMGEDRDDLLRRSPIAGIDQLKANILLVHGGLDQRVPYANFSQFTSALQRQGKRYEALTEAREGHGFLLQKHRLALYDKLLDFLDRNIGPTAGAAPVVHSP